MDWNGCRDVERTPGKVSGAWLVKGSRVQADAVVENAADGYSPEEIANEIFDGLPVDRVRRVIEYARRHAGAVRSARPSHVSSANQGAQRMLP